MTFEEFARFIDGALLDDDQMSYSGANTPSDITDTHATFYRRVSLNGVTNFITVTIECPTFKGQPTHE